MKTVIEMAREACDPDAGGAWVNHFWMFSQEELERFAELVRADQDEKYKWDVHSCGPTCTNAVCVSMREAVEAEREALIEIVDMHGGSVEIVAAIRARSNT